MPGPARRPRAEDLLVLLTVARLGRFSAAAENLGTARTTVARRLAELDRALGGRTLTRTSAGWELTRLGRRALDVAEDVERQLDALGRAGASPRLAGPLRVVAPEGIGAAVVVPALLRLREEHPDLEVQLISSTRRASRVRTGADLEVVIGRAQPRAHHRAALGEYRLRLYASGDYLERHGAPAVLADLARHALVTYVETELQVSEIGRAGAGLPPPRVEFQSTGLAAQLSAVRGGGGIGLLPAFLVEDDDPDLRPVLAGTFSRVLPIGALAHPDAARSPAVRAAVHALRREAADQRDRLLR